MTNVILRTDSYKLTHWNQYPEGTEKVYSYFESRKGAAFDETVFFGLQVILKTLEGSIVDMKDVDEAHKLAELHFGNGSTFNREGWKHIVSKHDGKLPVRIKAVPEGTPVTVNNVLMTVENTCNKCFWLTNAIESLLTHVWYPSTVATLSRQVKKQLATSLQATSDNPDAVDFMLQDFGYRGTTGDEAAARGGAAHLVNFKGTDTLLAMLLARDVYSASLEGLGFSVPATEHSVMTALGKDGELQQVERLLDNNPMGIVSCVADSYDYYAFVKDVSERYYSAILDRDGKFVFRPDSVTPLHPQPAQVVVWTLNQLWEKFGGTTNSKGFKVLDPHVGVLWGDGIDPHGIMKICNAAQLAGFSVENLVFGMGGGLLQKVNRDTQRFAFKCSAQMRDGTWHKVSKNPLDKSKASKAGRLALLKLGTGEFETLTDLAGDEYVGILKTVFEDGEIKKLYTFDEVRKNAKL